MGLATPSVIATIDPHATAAAFDRAAEDARIGLANVHTSPRRWVEVADGAPLIRCREIGVRQMKVPNAHRGDVTSFSDRSRRRLMALAASIRTKAMLRALFVTLTYPDEWDPSPCRWKRDLDTFLKRVRREWPRACVIWKLEFQKRGAPHFHMIVLNVPYMAYEWVADAWFEIVQSGDEQHRARGTQVRQVENESQVMSYVAKYIAKPGTDMPTDHAGRFWGISGRKYLPAKIRQIPCDKLTYDAVLDSMKNLIGWTGDPLDKLTYSRGLWLAVDQRTKRKLLRWLDQAPPVYSAQACAEVGPGD